MVIAMTTGGGRVTSLYKGVELLIADDDNPEFACRKIDTGSWQLVEWGKKLMHHDVEVLFCLGIDQFTLGMLQGYGIRVIKDMKGSPEELFRQWRAGGIPVDEE